MARFFFDFRDEEGLFIDSEGTELADHAKAELEATRALAEIARDRLPGSGGASMSLSVRDENGQHILTAWVVFRLERSS
jgi:hypothetical protein